VLGCEMYMARNYLGKTKEEQLIVGGQSAPNVLRRIQGLSNLCRMALSRLLMGFFTTPD
jgi:hypothetical protein